ncbi:MAG: L,D-transpeptidase family protein [Pseudobdellovibrionaceae bacterium]
MRPFRQLAFLPVLVVSCLSIQPLHSQEVSEPQAVSQKKGSLKYDTVIDVFSLEDIRSAISRVGEHGLVPSVYWSEDLERRYQKGEEEQRQLKPQANQAFLQLLMDISLGRIDPETLTPDIKLKRKKFLTPEQLSTLIVSTGHNADLLVDTMAPKNPLYLALKSSLARIYPACQNGQWIHLTPAKKTLRLGVKNPTVVDLKKYFLFLGYQLPNLDNVMDKETVNALKDVEWNMHLKPSGVLRPSGKVWKSISTPCLARVHQLQADMEKIRWFPSQFENRYLFINLAMTYVVLVDQTQNPFYITSFRTINGRVERKSPTMKDSIVRVILNPFWIVPPTIFVEDKVKEIRNLPRGKINEYFSSHHYEVWNKKLTHKVNPSTINWWSMDSTLDSKIYIRQQPNYMNALGVIKFELTNSFSVYLHDTNQRELFLEPQRLLSSGCIRLEKPVDLAEYLLKNTLWDRAKIEDSIAKPGQVMKRDTEIELGNPIAVYTMFLTSFLSNDGIIRFTEDTYEQNKLILQNLKGL